MAHDYNNIWLEIYQQHLELRLEQHNAQVHLVSWDGYEEVLIKLWELMLSPFGLHVLIDYTQQLNNKIQQQIS